MEKDPLYESNKEFESLRLRLSRLPRRPAPAALMRRLKKEYVGTHWLEDLREMFAWPAAWKPVGAFVLMAIIAGAWFTRSKFVQEDFIDGQPLMVAHARYQAETMVPQGDLASTHFGAQLAAYYGD